jgi:hypothetical protein
MLKIISISDKVKTSDIMYVRQISTGTEMQISTDHTAKLETYRNSECMLLLHIWKFVSNNVATRIGIFSSLLGIPPQHCAGSHWSHSRRTDLNSLKVMLSNFCSWCSIECWADSIRRIKVYMLDAVNIGCHLCGNWLNWFVLLLRRGTWYKHWNYQFCSGRFWLDFASIQ